MLVRVDVLSKTSNHTIGHTVTIYSIRFGNKIIEKHFILDRAIGRPDTSFSMNEIELTEMVKVVREAEKAIGHVNYSLNGKQQSGKTFSLSLYVVEDAKTGDTTTKDNVQSVRSRFGLHPKHSPEVLAESLPLM